MPQIDAGGAVTGCLSKEGLGAEASASSSSPVALAVSEDDALFNAGILCLRSALFSSRLSHTGYRVVDTRSADVADTLTKPRDVDLAGIKKYG